MNLTHTNPLEELMPVIKRASRNVAFQWPGVIDADDAEQSISLHLLERPSSITKIISMDAAARYRAVVGMGHQIASQARADYDYYKGAYFYSAKEVKELLQQGILDPVQLKFKAEKLDVTDALERIAPQYRESILSRYVEGEVPPRGAEQKRLVDATTALIDAMNAVHRQRFNERKDGPGTRSVISNASARTQADTDYNGEFESEPTGGGYR